MPTAATVVIAVMVLLGCVPSGVLFAVSAPTYSYRGESVIHRYGSATTTGGTSKDNFGTAASFHEPFGCTQSSTKLFVADKLGRAIRDIDPTTDAVGTWAGKLNTPGSISGPKLYSRFEQPTGVLWYGLDLLITDQALACVRSVRGGTDVIVYAGACNTLGYTDGTSLTTARFHPAFGIAGDFWASVFYITEPHRVRRLDGTAVSSFSGSVSGVDGTTVGTGSDARYKSPKGITRASSTGDLFVGDETARIRMLSPSAVMTVVAGTANDIGKIDGGATGTARVGTVHAMVLAPDDKTLFFGEVGGTQVRRLDLAAGIVSTPIGKDPASSWSSTDAMPAVQMISVNGLCAVTFGDKFAVVIVGNDAVSMLSFEGFTNTSTLESFVTTTATHSPSASSTDPLPATGTGTASGSSSRAGSGTKMPPPTPTASRSGTSSLRLTTTGTVLPTPTATAGPTPTRTPRRSATITVAVRHRSASATAATPSPSRTGSPPTRSRSAGSPTATATPPFTSSTTPSMRTPSPSRATASLSGPATASAAFTPTRSPSTTRSPATATLSSSGATPTPSGRSTTPSAGTVTGSSSRTGTPSGLSLTPSGIATATPSGATTSPTASATASTSAAPTASASLTRGKSDSRSLTRSVGSPTASASPRTTTPSASRRRTATPSLAATPTTTVTASITAVVPPPRPVLPVPVAVEETGQAAAATTAVVGSLASPGAATQVARVVGVMGIARRCKGGVAEALDFDTERLPFPQSLVPSLGFGAAKGYHFRGAIVANVALLGAVIALAVCAAVAVGRWRQYDEPVRGGLAAARMPGLAVVAAAVALDGTFMASLVLLLPTEGRPTAAGDVVLALVGLFASLGVVAGSVACVRGVLRDADVNYVPFMLVPTTASTTAADAKEAPPPSPEAVPWLSDSAVQPADAQVISLKAAHRELLFGYCTWIPTGGEDSAEARVLAMKGIVVRRYRCQEVGGVGGSRLNHVVASLCPWFFLVELALTIIVAGAQAATLVDCRKAGIASLVANALGVVTAALMRPYAVPAKNGMLVVVNVLMFLASALTLGAMGADQTPRQADELIDAGGRVAAAAAGASFISIFFAAARLLLLKGLWKATVVPKPRHHSSSAIFDTQATENAIEMASAPGDDEDDDAETRSDLGIPLLLGEGRVAVPLPVAEDATTDSTPAPVSPAHAPEPNPADVPPRSLPPPAPTRGVGVWSERAAAGWEEETSSELQRRQQALGRALGGRNAPSLDRDAFSGTGQPTTAAGAAAAAGAVGADGVDLTLPPPPGGFDSVMVLAGPVERSADAIGDIFAALDDEHSPPPLPPRQHRRLPPQPAPAMVADLL